MAITYTVAEELKLRDKITARDRTLEKLERLDDDDIFAILEDVLTRMLNREQLRLVEDMADKHTCPF